MQDNNELNIDVVYTRLGRQYKANGSPLAIPKKIAFSDDGVDYNLYNDNLTEEKRGLAIERMPMLPATTNEGSSMKYKLVTLPKQTSDSVSTFKLSNSSVTIEALTANGSRSGGLIITPINISAGFPTPNGFNITLYNSRYLYIDNPPVLAQRRGAGMDSYNETVYVGGNANLNKQIQIVKKEGSNRAPSNISFDIVYDRKYNVFTSNTDLTTKVVVESIDTGFTQEVDITLTKEFI